MERHFVSICGRRPQRHNDVFVIATRGTPMKVVHDLLAALNRNRPTSTRRTALAALISIAVASSGSPQASGQITFGQPTSGPRPVRLWDDQKDWVTALAFLKDGKHLCVGTYEEILMRDVRKSDAPKKLAISPGYVKSLALSPDGKLLAAGHYQTVSLIDTAAWKIKRTVGEHAGDVRGAAFSPDGKLLATACEEEVAHVWNVADGREARALRGHRFPVLAIAFSPDGSRIATAAGDETRITQRGEVTVWNTADGKEIFSFRNPRQAATD